MKSINKKIIIGGVVIILIGVVILLYFLFGKNTLSNLSSATAKTGDITETINLTGQVKASQGVDMAFEGSGKIVANYVKVGDKIYTGQPLVAIDSSLLQSQLQVAQAQLDALNINVVKSKTDAGLQTAYSSGLSSAQKSVFTAKDILLTITDIQNNHFKNQSIQNTPVLNYKSEAITALLGQIDVSPYGATSEDLGALNGGAVGAVQNAIQNPTQDNIDIALANTKTALQDVSNFVSAMPIVETLSPAERTVISTSKTSINAEIITTSTNIQTIASQKVNNSATLTTTDSQIEGAEANVNAIKTQISKTILRSLFDGKVDKDNVIVGAMESAGTPVITISNNNLEIDTNLPEIDISKAKIGNDANITLDAYGDNVTFPATIVSIDTAQTIVNGIPVYGAKLKFKNNDDTIKTGMTANINIISDTHKNVLLVPKSAVIQKQGEYFVIVDKGNGQKETRQVTIGLQDDKNIEVLSGLTADEKVLTY